MSGRSGGFGRGGNPNGCKTCANACKNRFERREAVIKAARDRADYHGRRADGPAYPGKPNAQQLAELQGRADRFEQYNRAMPRAQAAKHAYDDPTVNADCLQAVTDPKELEKLGVEPEDLENKKSGFKAVIYKSQSDGKYIVACRGTEPNSLVDWKTNIDNGQGTDTDQYRSARRLAEALQSSGTPFDIAGHSKGGGLATEAGLVATNSNIYTFNSAGLHPDSLGRTGASSFVSLDVRTQAFRSEGDFLTFMQETRDPAKQLENARFLRTELAGKGSGINPIAVKYRSPESNAAIDAANGWFTSRSSVEQRVDPGFQGDRKEFLSSLDRLIAQAEKDVAAGKDPNLFPPARGQKIDVPGVSGSSKVLGAFGPSAKSDEASLAKLNQHTMDAMIDSMEKVKKEDEMALRGFVAKPAQVLRPARLI